MAQRIDYAELVEDSEASRLAFRVHGQTSASSLRWTGDVRTSGFSSLNTNLGILTPAAYSAAIDNDATSPGDSLPTTNQAERWSSTGDSHIVPKNFSGSNAAPLSQRRTSIQRRAVREPWPHWTNGIVVRSSMMDHTTRRTRASFDVLWDGDRVGPDGLSPWISATRDLTWAIWEVARRLGQLGEESVELASIALSPPTNGREMEGAMGEVIVNPLPPLRDQLRNGVGTGERARLTNNEKEGLAHAIFEVETSSELLFLGRVFAESIVSNVEFTHEDLPVALPGWYFVPGEGSWLQRLVWRPEQDDFATARRILQRSRRSWGVQVARAKEQQKQHFISSAVDNATKRGDKVLPATDDNGIEERWTRESGLSSSRHRGEPMFDQNTGAQSMPPEPTGIYSVVTGISFNSLPNPPMKTPSDDPQAALLQRQRDAFEAATSKRPMGEGWI